MRSILSVVSPTSALLRLTFGQVQGSNLMSSTGYITIGTTSNLVDTVLATIKYTMDIQGITIKLLNIDWDLDTNNDANGISKIQISGDGGTTFFDVVNNIGAGVIATSGSGLWISNIDIGVDKLQIRVLGRSTDGNPATFKVYYTSLALINTNKRLI